MAFALYLAMTAGEIAAANHLPNHLCYMACHFSAYGTGLSNIPQTLPPDSVLILNDRMSVQGHDPELVGKQLKEAAQVLDVRAVLLDFQRSGCPQTAEIARAVVKTLDRPVAVSANYADALPCAVFLPPPPPCRPLEDYLTPWKGRPLWLEVSLDAQQITLTEKGSSCCSLPRWVAPDHGHADTLLHCHYCIDLAEQEAKFTLWRTAQNLNELLEEASCLGVQCAVGLYQEIGTFYA